MLVIKNLLRDIFRIVLFVIIRHWEEEEAEEEEEEEDEGSFSSDSLWGNILSHRYWSPALAIPLQHYYSHYTKIAHHDNWSFFS